jgi:hypothetical protein
MECVNNAKISWLIIYVVNVKQPIIVNNVFKILIINA